MSPSPITEALVVAFDCDAHGSSAGRLLAHILRDFVAGRASARTVKYASELAAELARERKDEALEDLARRAVIAVGGTAQG